MKISFVTANLNSGGAERVISLLANEFDQRGYHVEIIFLKERKVFYPVNPNVRIVVADEECHSTSMWRKMWWFRKYIKKTKPNAVIPFRVSVYTTTLFSLMGVRVPIISSERIDPRFPDPFWNLLRKLLLPFTSHLVVQTNAIKSYYPKFIQKKTSVILNPVRNIGNIDTSVQKENRIISVARLDLQKNQKMMMKAFSQIADEFPTYTLTIFGEGSIRRDLETLIEELELQDRIFLPGRTENVIEELLKSKIFCFSSDYEGLSNSMIEALCVGLPVVTTNVSGAEDFIENGKNGYIIPINDANAMAEALKKLLCDENLMAEIGKRNRQKGAMFSINGIFIQWENLIKFIVKNDRNKTIDTP